MFLNTFHFVFLCEMRLLICIRIPENNMIDNYPQFMWFVLTEKKIMLNHNAKMGNILISSVCMIINNAIDKILYFFKKTISKLCFNVFCEAFNAICRHRSGLNVWLFYFITCKFESTTNILFSQWDNEKFMLAIYCRKLLH